MIPQNKNYYFSLALSHFSLFLTEIFYFHLKEPYWGGAEGKTFI